MRMVYKELNYLLSDNSKLKSINFGLYFKKFIELNEKDQFKKYIDIPENPKKGIKKVDGNEVRMLQIYNNILQSIIKSLLENKNRRLDDYLNKLGESNYKIFERKFKLKKKMVIGIGETTAAEVGMTFDYTLGVPYIPASSIKGAVRNCYLINFIKEYSEKNSGFLDKFSVRKDKKEDYTIEENADEIKIWQVFGGDRKVFNIDKNLWGKENTYSGAVIFFDAYPLVKPELEIDITNVHYFDYYKDGKKSPSDSMEPNIIKFLTIKKGTEFKFRYAIDLYKLNDQQKIKKFEDIFKETLENYGIGAKKSLGYGLFDVKD